MDRRLQQPLQRAEVDPVMAGVEWPPSARTRHAYDWVTMKRPIFVCLLTTGIVLAFAMHHQARALAAAAAPAAAGTCASLDNRQIPASAIGLPTSGAVITSAALVPASPQTV